MKFDIEKVTSNVALYLFTFFLFFYQKNLFVNPINLSKLINPNYLYFWWFFALLDIVLFLVTFLFLFPQNKLLEKFIKFKFSPLNKIAILIMLFDLVINLNQLLTITLPKGFQMFYYNHDYILAGCCVAAWGILTPGFFYDKYRNLLSLIRTELFTLIITLNIFIDTIAEILNCYFINILFDVTTLTIMFVLLLPFLPLSKKLQEKYFINEKIKLKITLFLYFLLTGAIVIENNYSIMLSIVFMLISIALAFPLAKWFTNKVLTHKTSLIKKLFSLGFFILLFSYVYKTINSLEMSQNQKINSCISVANIYTVHLIDNEMLAELNYLHLSDKNNFNKINMSSSQITEEYDFFYKHLMSTNFNFSGKLVTQIPERERQSLYEFHKDYNMAYLNILDGLNNLKKYKETGKPEYKLDAEVNFSKYNVQYQQMRPIINEINSLLEKDDNQSAISILFNITNGGK